MESTRVALVTGANRGIGREVARQLADRGVAVVLGCRDRARGAAAARELAAEGRPVEALPLDVTDPDDIRSAADTVAARFGRLDILINNAALFAPHRAVETTGAQLRRLFEVNVFAVADLTAAMLPLLAKSAGPRIVNVSSTTASMTLTTRGADLPGNADVRMAYTSAKAALNMLTVQYAQAFRSDPVLAHVKINSASPGWTATEMNGFQAPRPVSEGARALVTLALLPDDGPTGGFFDEAGTIPW